MAFDPKEFLAESTEVKKEEQPKETKVETPTAESKFNPQEFLKEQPKTTEIPQPAPVVPQFAVPGPTGINPGEVAAAIKPAFNAVPQTLGGYIKNPIQAVADIGAMHMGLPPPVATYQGFQGLKNTYHGVQEALNNVNFKLGGLKEAGPEIRGAFDAIRDKLPANIIEEMRTKGGNALRSTQLPEHLLQDAEFMKNWNMLKGQAPTTMQKIGAVAGPAVRGIGKVLGPAGLALNAYDAAQYAQDSQLGQRLAQGQGGVAQRNFRQMTPGYGAPVSANEATAVMENGSARDIAAMGGQESLNMAIRMKAAKKVLGQ